MANRDKILKQKMKAKNTADSLTGYFHVIAIVPGFIAILAYEFLIFFLNIIKPEAGYSQLDGLGILIPMILLMELFTFFMTTSLRKKVKRLTDGIGEVAKGNYNVSLDPAKAGPLEEVYEDFNKMTDELSGVDTLRNDFINDFSHEFKTPIVSIKGFADLLLAGAADEEEKQEYLKIISEESDRLQHLTEETLMMSRLQKQQIITDLTDYELDEQLRKVLIMLQKEWEAKGITVDVELEPVTFHGNENLMMHVWINFLNNAIKFTDEGGKIRVSLAKNGGPAVVTIADNGCGMTEETAAHIFNKYYQGDSSRKTKGLGLGLSIAHRIIELCGGNISVDTKIDCGTTFTISIPLSETK